MEFFSNKDLNKRISRLENAFAEINSDTATAALIYLIDNGRLRSQVPTPTVNIEIESSSVENFVEATEKLKQHNNIWNLNITGRIKVG